MEEGEQPEKKYDEVDFDSAIEDFGEETVQFCVAAFLDKTYKELKTNIPKLYKTQNYKEIRGKMHILKTNSGYMGAANFSALCKEFETSCKFESLNEEKIDELYPIFMTNLDKLYVKLKKMNKEKFESPQEPETEPQKEKVQENKENNENKDNKEKKENNENKDNKENNENKENKDNKENKENNEKKENNENNEKKENKENNENKDNKENKDIINNDISKDNNENVGNQDIKDNNINNQNNENKQNENSVDNNINENNEKEDQNQSNNNINNNEIINNNTINNKNKTENYEIMEEIDEEESGNLIELRNCPKESTKDITLKDLGSSSKPNVIDNEINKPAIMTNREIQKHSLTMRKLEKIRNLSSSNIHELGLIKEGKLDTFRGDPKYKKIFQSFKLTHEEKKKKTGNTPHSPRHAVETEKHKVLNRVKLGFSTMDKNEIRDCLKRYDIAVLKNSATLVKENLIKFLDGVFPSIINDFNNYLNECDLSQKKEIIEKIKIIISNMKYLSDNYNIYFFRMNERLEICKDKEKFKLILTKLIQKLHMLEEELTIIYKVKIKRDDSLLLKLGYFPDNNNIAKNSKKNLSVDLYNYRNKENNNEQIEGLKKNLGINNNGKIKELKTSRKKLKHFPYSFKNQKLFMIEDKKQIHNSLKNIINRENSKVIKESDKNLVSDFEKDLPKFINLFKESISNKDKDQLIKTISDFETEIAKKYGFSNMLPIMDKWVAKIKKGESFDELNANIEDIEEVINSMKQELANQNIVIINHEEDGQENEDNYYEEEKNIKNEEDHLEKEDLALYSQLRQFNASSFFQPKNQGLSQHKFKLKVEKIIRETTGNANEIIQNNKNSNYNLVEKISSHIVLSQNFRTKKNKLIGFSYPFKEDTILNNCCVF